MDVLIGKKSIRDNFLVIEIISLSESVISAVFSIYVDHDICFSQIINIQKGTNIFNIDLKITKENQYKNGILVISENHKSDSYMLGHFRIPGLHEVYAIESDRSKESLFSKLSKIDKERIQSYIQEFNQNVDKLCLKGKG
jgi:hypothetical protein